MNPPRKRTGGKGGRKKKAVAPAALPEEAPFEQPEAEPSGLEAVPVSGAAGETPPSAETLRVSETRTERLQAEVTAGLEAVTAGGGGEAPPPPTEQTASFDFSEFFQRVGQGLVDAQRKMDAESLKYLQEVSVQPHVLPSIFRIPQITANVKFALTQESDKSVGIIFYKDESKEQTLNQQSVEFNIVSVPAPVQLNAPVGVSLVFSAGSRAQILEMVRAFQLVGVQDTAAQLGLQAALANPDQILVYALSPGVGLYLAYADGQAKENVGFWFVAQDPTQVLVIRRFGDPGGAGLQALHDLILAQGKSQAEFLSRTKA